MAENEKKKRTPASTMEGIDRDDDVCADDKEPKKEDRPDVEGSTDKFEDAQE